MASVQIGMWNIVKTMMTSAIDWLQCSRFAARAYIRDAAGTPAMSSLPLIGAACAARTFSLRHKTFKMTVEAFSILSGSNED